MSEYADKLRAALIGNRCTSPDGTMVHEGTLKVCELASFLHDGEMAFKLADDQFWKLKAEQAESERDEARSSLGRAEEVLQELWAKSDPFELPETLIEKVRSALHIPRG